MAQPAHVAAQGRERDPAAVARRRALLAPDSFKGTLSAAAVVHALATALEPLGWELDRCPLADGGEGTGEALAARIGGRSVEADVHDPLARPLRAAFTLLDGPPVAIVEVAAASGLALLDPSERDPERTTTRGTGELILAALAAGAEQVLVGVGGSATNDGGGGAVEAIRERGGLGDARLACLCDVHTPWERASATFGPQKGADAAAVERLERRLDRLADDLPRDPRGVPMSGAAGGLAGGLWASFDAALVPGAAYLCDRVDLDRRLQAVDLAITGEGRLDATTLEGKVVAEVGRRGALHGVEVHAVVGEDASGPALRADLGLSTVREASTADEIGHAAAELVESR
jgi:glycerate 2-kinase